MQAHPARALATVLLVNLLLAVAVYLYYNLTFVQFQGRYVYSALGVIALGVALAWRQWGQWLALRLRLSAALTERWLLATAALSAAGLAGVAVFALYCFIIPALMR